MPESIAAKTKVLILDEPPRWVPMPEGYYRVVSGAAKPSDLSLCLLSFIRDGRVVWHRVDEIQPGKEVHSRSFDVLIRKGVPVDEVCPRCEARKPAKGWKYCRPCCHEVKQDLRATHRED